MRVPFLASDHELAGVLENLLGLKLQRTTFIQENLNDTIVRCRSGEPCDICFFRTQWLFWLYIWVLVKVIGCPEYDAKADVIVRGTCVVLFILYFQ